MIKITDIKEITPGMNTFKIEIVRSQTPVKWPVLPKDGEPVEAEIPSSS